MSTNPFPSQFPIFPLPNVVMFPQTSLPLHIFEPRYRAMTRAALEGDQVIGMILLVDGDSSAAQAPVYPTGCAGRVVEARELPDGRFNLLLRGTRRFRLLDDALAEGGYRVADVELLHDPGVEELSTEDTQRLAELRPHLERSVLSLTASVAPAAREPLRARIAELDMLEFVHTVCFGLDCTTVEKQGLLEASGPVERATLLRHLLDFRLAERKLPETPNSIN